MKISELENILTKTLSKLSKVDELEAKYKALVKKGIIGDQRLAAFNKWQDAKAALKAK